MSHETLQPDDSAPQSGKPMGFDSAAINRARDLLDQIPDAIGRYKILERIGGGGMGEVYVAEQTAPIKRRVALKLIKAGMDTKQVVARFEAERQALAMMDHPNIAKVFDAGTTDTGRPYFVMELVRGVPVTQFCDEAKLTTRQRIELLVPICQAVQHAHQKGIIHRDLKPTNVLVTLHDGKPVPKVIDFGIAKATSQPLTDKTVYTEFRQMIGTPAYMSPEQAEMSGLDIDTRSDIYSLGVLMYELLTGTTPFDTTRLVHAGIVEIQRIIKEEEPPRPSLRISSLGLTLPSTAAQRSIEPARLGKLVAGELDWIVMKALEKDRKRRYESASGMAADLQRHLDGEPIVAAPPGVGYRARKFVRKHRKAVSSGIAAVLLLGVGLIGTTTQMIRAWTAEAESEKQRVETERQTERLSSVAETIIGKYFNEPGDGGDLRTGRGSGMAWYPSWSDDKDTMNRDKQVSILFQPDRSAKLWFGPDLQSRRPEVLAEMLTTFGLSGIKERDEKLDAAETEAYIANLALGQAAMQADRWPEARQRLDACPESKRGWEWKYLRQAAANVDYAFEDNGRVAAVSPNGLYVCSIKPRDSASLRDLRTGELICPKLGIALEPDGRFDRINITRPAFSPQSDRVVICAGTGVNLYDLKGRLLAGPMRHENPVEQMAFAPDGQSIVTRTQDSVISRWSLEGKLLGPAPADDPALTDLKMPHSLVLVEDENFDYIKLNDPIGRTVGVSRDFVTTGYIDPVFLPGGKYVTVMAGKRDDNFGNFVPERRLVLDISHFDAPWFELYEDNEPDLETELLAPISDNTSTTQGKLSVTTPDGSRIITCTGDMYVRFLDAHTRRELAIVTAVERVTRLRMSSDGTRLILNLADKTVQIWDTRDDAARQKDRDARFAEIKPAREYVQNLLASDIPTDKLKEHTRTDSSISTRRKLVAMELLNVELASIDTLALKEMQTLRNENITQSKILKAAERHLNLRLRPKLIAMAKEAREPMETYWTILEISNDPAATPERYNAAAEAAEQIFKQYGQSEYAIYYRIGRYEKCLELIERSLKEDQDHPQAYPPRIHSYRAMCFFRLKRFDEANAELKIAQLRAMPDDYTNGPLAEAIALIDPASTQPATRPTTVPAE